MGIQFNPKEFSITFIQIGTEYITEKKIDTFFDTIDELDLIPDEQIITVKENITLNLRFTSNTQNAKFYMDGLDMFDVEIDDDESESFFHPKKEDISLYKNGEYPLIPGYYNIRVEIEDKRFYSKIQVQPIHIGIMEWKIIKDDLNKCVNGLAEDFVRKNNTLYDKDNTTNIISISLHQKLIVFNKYSSRIVEALSDLALRANYKIVDEYIMTPLNKTCVINAKTIRYRQMHGVKNNKIYAPVKKLTYDLPENRYLKKTLQNIKKMLKTINKSLNAFIEAEKNNIAELNNFNNDNRNMNLMKLKQKSIDFLEKNICNCCNIREFIDKFEREEWFKEIDVSGSYCLRVVPQIILDSRYNIFYKLNKSLYFNKFSITQDAGYDFQYKRTDKLYELWGFLQIHKEIIGGLGFKPISGWIYDEKYDLNEFIIPVLLSKTTITYHKDNMFIRYTYDGVIPNKSDETIADEIPIYSTNVHNRPDGRIDFYIDNGVYIGSIIVDFKYRNPRSFWDETKSPRMYPKAMRQLLAYRNDCESVYLYDNTKYRRLRPVSEVWAVYPKSHSDDGSKNFYSKDTHMRLLNVYPGIENSLHENLKEKMKELIEQAKEFC